jgi:hypothetical protein
MRYFVYKTTNIIDGKTYIGVHKTTNIDDGYLGSGKWLLRAIKKYGEGAFKREIISYHDTHADAFEEEKRIVNEEFCQSKDTYNFKVGGSGGNTIRNRKWVNNGIDETYAYIDQIPEGWVLGRLKGHCVFSDPKIQSELSLRVDFKKRGESIKNAWANGKMDHRDHTKCGHKGDLHPAKRPEVRAKISKSQSHKLVTPTKTFDSIQQACDELDLSYRKIAALRKKYPNEWYVIK